MNSATHLPPPLIHDDMTFDDIVSLLEWIESDDLKKPVLSEEEHRRLSALLFKKVDACKFKLDSWEDEAKRLREYAREFTEAARVVEARYERLCQYLSWSMRRNGSNALPGDKFIIRLRRSEAVEIDDAHAKPDSELFQAFPEFIRQKLELNLSAVKDALKAGTHNFAFARLKENHSTCFTVRKSK